MNYFSQIPSINPICQIKRVAKTQVHTALGCQIGTGRLGLAQTLYCRLDRAEGCVGFQIGEAIHFRAAPGHQHLGGAGAGHELGDDPGLSKDGVEAHLQELLAADPTVIEDGLILIAREYPTAIGPVDLLCRASDGTTVAIEIKRRGEIDGVEQLGRYLEYLRVDTSLGVLRGVFVAQSIKPQARTLAETRGLTWKEVDYDELRGRRVDELRLF